MCGICGFVNLNGTPVDAAIIARMNRAMFHRGPDDEGVRIDGDTAMAMRRLSIMDPAGGHQPISNEGGDIWIVFNGEIYNAGQLRETLKQQGHHFETTTDTETIVHQFEQDGIDGVHALRGMFSYALHDVRPESGRCLLLMRDRLGIKPLYYYRDQKLLAFSSELTSLLQHPEIAREIDPVALNQYLATGIVASPATMFRNVRQLMPGHYLMLKGGELTEKAYWRIPGQSNLTVTFEEACSRTRVLLEESVKEHLVSDVPVGAFLSGGIDSSTIVAMMAQASSRPITTFSVRFQGSGYDESAYARMVAERYQTEHYEFSVPDKGFDEGLLRGMITHHGQPTADSSALPTFMVSSLARQHVKVVLSGDGGDECFAGYSHYGWLKKIGLLCALPLSLRKALLATLRGGANTTLFGGVSRLRTVINALEASLAGKHRLPLEVLRLNGADSINSLLQPKWRMVDADVWQDIDDELANSDMDTVASAQRFSCRYFMPDAYLPKVDRMSMAASLEVRVPFLDHRLVEYALSLPGEMHWQKGVGKQVLRAAVADLLPDDVFSHKKQGFSIPLHTWADENYYKLAEDLLNEDAVRRRGIFDPISVRRLIERCRGREQRRAALESEYRLSHRLFQLVVFELWCRMYLDDLPEIPSLANMVRHD
ncbi:asparagine synthase (glutamine-hydrolyzing) [Mariprofundus ferrooxydans]|uniref:asparagine synthase (glutamine-hydrolyzing) n=1 Tax=Mariprofundus ferrooxydans TaxID=314344 RepID=UPI0023EB8CAA|nr:asparagine synthase (glutamine-hydrolyzing) [Mariprofundus ferrooxydans]